MPGADDDHDFVLLVFAKAPVAGSAKTRLIPLLGADGAALAQAQLLNHALDTASAARPAQLQLWCTPDTTHPGLIAAAERCGASLYLQQGADLGARLRHAFSSAFTMISPVICIGSDCPALTPTHLREAAARLKAGSDVVLVPAEDGGYTLIAINHTASREVAQLFAGISWGGDQVLAQTRERLHACGLRWQELETLWDVDRPQDWQRLQASGLLAAEQKA